MTVLIRGESGTGKELGRCAILEALQARNGLIARAARTLSINRRILRYKLQKYGITNPESTRRDVRVSR